METPPNNQDSQEQDQPKIGQGPNTLLKVVVLILLVILLIVGILLPIKLVPNAFTTVTDTISSWFKNEKTVEITADTTNITSGDQVTLSWNNAPSSEGTYALSYGCTNGVHVETSIASPDETVACGGNYYFSSATSSIAVSIFSDISRYTEVTLSLSFLENGSSTPEKLGDITIDVMNSNATSTATSSEATEATTTPTAPVTENPATTTATTVSTPPRTPTTSTITHVHKISNPNGNTDLSVRVIGTGYMNDNAEFIPAATITGNQRAAFKFVVTNIGDKNSGPWSFTTVLPTVAHPTYSAYNLPNLGPGDSIAYVLGFDTINNARTNSISITVDPSNVLGDYNRTNNYAQTTITNISAY